MRQRVAVSIAVALPSSEAVVRETLAVMKGVGRKMKVNNGVSITRGFSKASANEFREFDAPKSEHEEVQQCIHQQSCWREVPH